MTTNFKTDGFQPWKKANLKEGELAEYIAYQNKNRDRIVLFESADEMIRHFKHNVKEFGGNGTWTCSHGETNRFRHNCWRFGDDFSNYDLTEKALSAGKMADIYLDKVEQVKEEISKQFPQLSQLEELAIRKRRRRRFREDGDELCIDRYMNGDTGIWGCMPKIAVRSKTARVYLDIYGTAGISPETLAKNFIYGLALVDILDKAGVSVEVLVGATVHHPTHDTNLMNVVCKAKGADEPLDISRLLSFCLTGMFRQFMFVAWENIADKKTVMGLGTGDWSFERHKEYFDFFDAAIMVRGGDPYWTQNQMHVQINNVLKFLGEEEMPQ